MSNEYYLKFKPTGIGTLEGPTGDYDALIVENYLKAGLAFQFEVGGMSNLGLDKILAENPLDEIILSPGDALLRFPMRITNTGKTTINLFDLFDNGTIYIQPQSSLNKVADEQWETSYSFESNHIKDYNPIMFYGFDDKLSSSNAQSKRDWISRELSIGDTAEGFIYFSVPMSMLSTPIVLGLEFLVTNDDLGIATEGMQSSSQQALKNSQNLADDSDGSSGTFIHSLLQSRAKPTTPEDWFKYQSGFFDSPMNAKEILAGIHAIETMQHHFDLIAGEYAIAGCRLSFGAPPKDYAPTRLCFASNSRFLIFVQSGKKSMAQQMGGLQAVSRIEISEWTHTERITSWISTNKFETTYVKIEWVFKNLETITFYKTISGPRDLVPLAKFIMVFVNAGVKSFNSSKTMEIVLESIAK